MSVSNLPDTPGPVDDTPLSQNQGADAIADLLDDSDLDPNPEEDHEAKPADSADDGLDDEDDLDALPEDAGDEVPEDDDGPQDTAYAGGRFAADNAKVTLDDGSVITVADLKRNNLFQRDYTKKTTELSAEREQITVQKSKVDQAAEQLSKEREFLIWFAEANIPPAPTPPSDPNDYVAEINYARAQRAHDQMVQAWQTFQGAKQAEDARKADETASTRATRLKGEVSHLVEALPILKDTAKQQPFFDRLTREAKTYYGFEPDQVLNVEDHRFLVALADANAYRRLKAKAPQVQKEVAARPALVTGSGKRAAPQAKVTRERNARSERLRNSGSREAGIAALMDLDL